MITSELRKFPNIGFMGLSFDDEDMLPVRAEIRDIIEGKRTNPSMKSRLAGALEHEYELLDCVSYLETLLLPYFHEYLQKTNLIDRYCVNVHDSNIVIGPTWVNIMKKFEYNPIHNHSGLLSFVIWLEVPYDIEDEKIKSPGYGSNKNTTGCFQFQYTDILGAICNLDIEADKDFVNKGMIFPAALRHSVYPFFGSDGNRISVSGNVLFNK